MTGALARKKVRATEPTLPAASVCEIVTAFCPSPVVNVTAKLYVLLAQAWLTAAVTPEPFATTANVPSQAPVIVRPVCADVFAAGEVMDTTGATLSRTKLREIAATLPALSVCESDISFTPSPADKVTACVNAPFAQPAFTAAATPAPLIATGSAFSQVPIKVREDINAAFATGDDSASAGAVVSKIKLREERPVTFEALVCETTTFFEPSPVERATVAAKVPAAQVAVIGDETPVPLTVTTRPAVHVPCRAILPLVTEFAAG